VCSLSLSLSKLINGRAVDFVISAKAVQSERRVWDEMKAVWSEKAGIKV